MFMFVAKMAVHADSNFVYLTMSTVSNGITTFCVCVKWDMTVSVHTAQISSS